MWRHLLPAIALVLSNVVIHGLGAVFILGTFNRLLRHPNATTVPRALWTLLRFFLVIMTLHLLEGALWAQFYFWMGCFPDRETAYYFSLTSYTTVGYGDLVLPRPWRLMGPLEAMTGVLLFGWSTAMLLALTTRFREARQRDGMQP